MENPGEQADILRALGSSLDEAGATGIEILNHGAFLAVFWQGPGQDPGSSQQAYREHELSKLRAKGRAMRQGFGGGSPGGRLEELLRALGQALDRDGMDVSGIVQQDEGFLVSVTVQGRYAPRLYKSEELLALSAERRSARSMSLSGDADGTAAANALLGLPVVSSDEQVIGKVKEVRGPFLKIDGGFLQRDFWLSAECVISANPGERVLLHVSKPSLNQHKRHDLPAGA